MHWVAFRVVILDNRDEHLWCGDHHSKLIVHIILYLFVHAHATHHNATRISQHQLGHNGGYGLSNFNIFLFIRFNPQSPKHPMIRCLCVSLTTTTNPHWHLRTFASSPKNFTIKNPPSIKIAPFVPLLIGQEYNRKHHFNGNTVISYQKTKQEARTPGIK